MSGELPAGARRVHLRKHADHVELELCDAERGNPLGDALISELSAAVADAAADPDCRAALISAAGPSFCSGLDLGRVPRSWYADPAAVPPWRLFCLLRDAPLVTVALVDGAATGGGVALAAACDLVAAGQHASFRFTELLLGLIPAMALPFVADRVGFQAAWRMALTAVPVGPGEAARIGLADLEYPDARAGAREILTMLRRTTPDTIRAVKLLRERLYPRPDRMAGEAGAATIERLVDEKVIARIDLLRACGVLS
jgi:polyketide biosynthesis enoyl-CoA hydratase PksH